MDVGQVFSLPSDYFDNKGALKFPKGTRFLIKRIGGTFAKPEVDRVDAARFRVNENGEERPQVGRPARFTIQEVASWLGEEANDVGESIPPSFDIDKEDSIASWQDDTTGETSKLSSYLSSLTPVAVADSELDDSDLDW